MSKRMGTFSIDKPLKIEQVLHGYADGHRLLKASMKLSSEVERVMLFLSDMSGSSMVPGFESYVTGYPLRDVGAYALARTWYAPEMPRPGCVWTHTLLIANSDLARIKDLVWLSRLFVRPQRNSESWASYDSPLLIYPNQTFTDEIYNDLAGSKKMMSLATHILFELYSSRRKPVYLATNNPSQYEELFLLIWSQQWPRLRRSFRFCTGSIANRKIENKSFDLQAIPLKLRGHIDREEATGKYLDDTKLTLESFGPPDWVEIANKDLFNRPSSKLKDFFRSYGADVNIDRYNYSRLIIIFSLIEDVNMGKTPLDELIQRLSEFFPNPRSAARLKAALFGMKSDESPSTLLKAREVEILQKLVTTQYYTGFNKESLGIHERAKALSIEQPIEAQNILLKIAETELSPLGEEFLISTVETVKPEILVETLSLNFEMLNKLLKYNPALVTVPKVWLISPEKQRSLFTTTEQVVIREKLVTQVVIAMLEAGTDVLAEQCIAVYGDEAIKAILDWISRLPFSHQAIGENWKHALKSRPQYLLQWIATLNDSYPSTIAFIISLLDPHSRSVIDFGGDVWLHFARSAQDTLDASEFIKSMTFLLALGFNNPPSGAAELVATSFESVHNAAAQSKLPGTCWNQLRLQIPVLFFWKSWDHCYILRSTLVDKFAQFGWPTSLFLETVKSKKTFSLMVDYCKESGGGRKFLRKVAEDVYTGRSKASEEQRNILYDYYK